jgi:DNA mismatch repair protein MutL
MAAIRILPDRIANQIAAGEVIERPAAVVKELLENSLDAGATRVEVEFRNGGRSYIRVEDNGSGMSENNALLSLERHATSKIADTADLMKISTFGFRGEALPSIASVSRFLMQTRTEEAEHGTEIFVNGGKFVHVRQCGMPAGTRIEVNQLFNSVPARRKFLKTDATEAGHIIQTVRLHAIAHPKVAFKVIENGRIVFQSAACPGLEQRLTELFGRGIRDLLLPLETQTGDLGLSGFIGKPTAGRATRHEMLTFVNSRPVDSRTLSYALIESYHNSLPKGRYPIAFLFLQIDPAGVDVNVHPAKREVRFREESRVRSFVIRAVLERLRPADPAPEAPRPAAPPAAPAAVAGPTPPGDRTTAPIPAWTRTATAPPPPPRAPVSMPPPAATARVPVIHSRPPLPESPSPAAATSATRPTAWRWRFIGQARGNLALFETEAGVVIMDRRAAHERLMYEEILQQFKDGDRRSQALLFAVPLELDPVGSALLTDHLEFLNSNGFEISPFGRQFFRIEGVPHWLQPGMAEEFIRDLLSVIRERGLPENQPELARERIATLAARKAIRISDRVTEEEIIGLARKLLQCANPLTSPLGRSTFFEMPAGEIEKRLQK